MKKLERARHFFKHAMRPGLKVISLSFLAASAYATIIPPSNPTVFDVSGTFEGGATLSGAIDIDTVGNGGVTGGDFTLTTSHATYDIANLTPNSQFDFANYWQVEFTGNGGVPELFLAIVLGNATNLDGYTGGALCSNTVYCSGNASDFSFQHVDPPLVKGNVSLATPEPASLPLIFTGAGAAVLTLLRKKRNKG